MKVRSNYKLWSACTVLTTRRLLTRLGSLSGGCRALASWRLGGGPLGGGQHSKDLHSLVKTIANVKVAAKARALGREISDKELRIVFAQVRNYLSVTFIRTQSLCLLNRLGFHGDGAKAATGRRDLAKRLEEGKRRERQARYLAHVRVQGLSHTGQIFVMWAAWVRKDKHSVILCFEYFLFILFLSTTWI